MIICAQGQNEDMSKHSVMPWETDKLGEMLFAVKRKETK